MSGSLAYSCNENGLLRSPRLGAYEEYDCAMRICCTLSGQPMQWQVNDGVRLVLCIYA